MLKIKKKNEYQFISLNETIIAYKRIKMMSRAYINKITLTPWKNEKNKTNIILSDSEKEDDDNFINSNNKKMKVILK